MRARWIAIAVLVALCGTARAQCADKVASFDLVQNSAGDIIIPASFNDLPGHMVLNFAAANSLLYPRVVDHLGLVRKGIGDKHFFNALGEMIFDFVEIPSVAIGKHAGHMTAFASRRPVNDIDGWFGLDILSNFDLEMDFPHKRVNIFEPSHCDAKKIVTWSNKFTVLPLTLHKMGNFDFPVRLDGHDLQMGLSVLTPSSRIFLPNASEALSLTTTSPGMTLIPGPETVSIYRYPFRSLMIGDIEIQNPPLMVAYVPPMKCLAFERCYGSETPAFLSLNGQTRLHFYLAYRQKKMFLTFDSLAEATPSPTASQSEPSP